MHDNWSELDLNISFDQTGVLHMKDHTAKTSEYLNQPAISGNNNETAIPGNLPEYKHLFFPSRVFWGQTI